MRASGLNSTPEKRRNPWLWVPSLYFIEGLPNALVVTVALALFKDMGISNDNATIYTSLFYLPWVIKPFWSPFVDMFGTKRRWIIAMQLMMAAGVGVIALTLNMPHWLAAALAAFWALAFCSATHDIAADGFYLLALPDKEQAFFVGIRSTFYRLANLFAAGGVVWMAGKMIDFGNGPAKSWSIIIGALALMFAAAAIWHAVVLPHPAADTPNRADTVGKVLSDFAETVKTFFMRKGIVVALAFMLLYRLPEAVLCKMVLPFLRDPQAAGGLGLSTAEVGVANGVYGVAGIVLGGIIGGIIMARYGLRRCLWPMALSLTLPSAFYCYLAGVQPENVWLIRFGIGIEQFGYGFGFTAYMMYLMRFSEGSAYTTSHYAFSTGVMALGLMLPGMLAGKLQMAVGYPAFFAIVMLLCVPTFIVTWLVRRTL